MFASYREFANVVLDGVRRVGESFEAPDADWVPALLVDSRVHGFVPIGFTFSSDKDAVVAHLAQIIQQTQSERIGLILSSWCAEVDASWDGVTPARKLPSRYEIVAVTIMDAERIEGYSARIERFEDAPPRLGAWSVLTPENGFVTGRFVEPLQDAMR